MILKLVEGKKCKIKSEKSMLDKNRESQEIKKNWFWKSWLKIDKHLAILIHNKRGKTKTNIKNERGEIILDHKDVKMKTRKHK